MTKNSGVLEALPDKPLTRSSLEAIDEIASVRRAITPTWQSPSSDPEREFSDDLIIITDDRVRYYSRERGDGWVEKRNETYADDDEFEDVMDDVHDYACEYSEERIERYVKADYNV